MVVRGVVTYISGRSVIVGDPKVILTETMGGSLRAQEVGKDLQRGMINRQLVQIGDTQLTNVVMPTLCDAMLVRAMEEGEEVELSLNGPDRAKRMTIVSMKTAASGLYKPPLFPIVASMALTGVWVFIVAVVLAVIAGVILGSFVHPILGGLAAIVVIYFILYRTLRFWFRGLRARGALG